MVSNVNIPEKINFKKPIKDEIRGSELSKIEHKIKKQFGLSSEDVKDKKFDEYADNFFRFMMDNFETELVVMGAKIALKTYKLPIEPSQLKTFDEFHKKYGKYIVEAGN